MKKDEITGGDSFLARLRAKYIPIKPTDTKFKRFLKDVVFSSGLILFVFVTILLLSVSLLAL